MSVWQQSAVADVQSELRARNSGVALSVFVVWVCGELLGIWKRQATAGSVDLAVTANGGKKVRQTDTRIAQAAMGPGGTAIPRARDGGGKPTWCASTWGLPGPDRHQSTADLPQVRLG